MKITKETARALLAHASDDTTRPHLHAIGYCGRAGVLFATDGHRLAIHWDDDTKFTAWLTSEDHPQSEIAAVPRTIADQAVALCTSKRGKNVPEDEIEFSSSAEGQVTIQVHRGDGLPTAPMVASADVRYPSVVQVIPAWWREKATKIAHEPEGDGERRTAADLWCIDADYLVDVAKLAASTSELRRTNGVRVYAPAHPLDPMVVEANRAAVVLMPMRL
jgi:hypothetical protein